jgi:hypothetical protein
MPRIKGLGELDWDFASNHGSAIYSPYTMSSDQILCFKIRLDDVLDSIDFPCVICHIGEFTYRETPFCRGSIGIRSLDEVRTLPEVAYAVQRLSLLYPSGIKVCGDSSHQFLSLRIAVPNRDAWIEWPTKFVTALAQKIEKYARDFRQKTK